jgi:hypothetical protein
MVFSRIAVTNNHRDDARRASAVQTLIILGNMTEETRKNHLNSAYKAGKQLARKFEIEDVNNSHLIIAAQVFAYTYRGTFQYMLDMSHALTTNGELSPAQTKGVLNCLMAEARRNIAAKQAERGAAPAAPAPAVATVEDETTLLVAQATVAQAPVRDGYFTVAFGDGTHRTFRLVELREEECTRYGMPRGAQHISLLVGPENTSNYARIGIVVNRQIVRRWRVIRTVQGQNATSDQLSRMEEGMRVLLGADGESQTEYGMAYAIASNRCSRCGHVLTVPASVHRGLGPDCATRI